APICHKGQEGSELGRASAGIRAAATAVVRQELAGSGMAAIKRAQASLGNGSFTQRLARGRDTGPGNGAAAASGTERLLAQAEKTQMGVANDHGSTPSLASECARMQQRPVDPDQTKLRPIAPRVQGHDAPLRAATAVARRDPCTDCPIRSRALCRALSTEQLARLRRLSYRKRYPSGRLITGVDPAESWCAQVVSGVVKLTKTLPDGRQQIVGLLFPADFLGRPFAASSPYAAEAATAVELCCFNRRQLEELMHEQASLKQLFLERTLDEVDAVREWMLLLGRKSAGEKVAALILHIAQRLHAGNGQEAAQPQPVRLDLPLSRTEMADYLGLRIETVSRQLKHLRTAGVIDTGGGRAVTVRDIAALSRMTESIQA